METTFFATADDFRVWLEEHHATAKEIGIGLYRKGVQKPGITHREALDLALGYGWIDGRANRVGDDAWRLRFTPRRKGSIWSDVNIRRVNELIELGLMRPSGMAAFEAREESKSRVYSYENTRSLDPDIEARFRAHTDAWAYFEQQPPSYRRLTSYWVMSAKREETRLRRLATLIDESAQGRRIDMLNARSRKDSASD